MLYDATASPFFTAFLKNENWAHEVQEIRFMEDVLEGFKDKELETVRNIAS